MTTGSVSASEQERKWAAQRSRWWNSTGGGSMKKEGIQKGNVKAGDGGQKFRTEWPELDKENWKWMKENNIDVATGREEKKDSAEGSAASGGRDCSGMGIRRPGGSGAVVGAVVEGGREGRGWVRRHKWWVVGTVIFTYVLIARLLGDGAESL